MPENNEATMPRSDGAAKKKHGGIRRGEQVPAHSRSLACGGSAWLSVAFRFGV